MRLLPQSEKNPQTKLRIHASFAVHVGYCYVKTIFVLLHYANYLLELSFCFLSKILMNQQSCSIFHLRILIFIVNMLASLKNSLLSNSDDRCTYIQKQAWRLLYKLCF